MKTIKIGMALLLGAFVMQAQAGERTGKEIVDGVCASCHAEGKNGAPRLGDRAEWSRRAAKGLDKMTINAITGVRSMPAHGGQASLTDVEMSRAVAYMVSGGNAADTHKAYASPQRRTGEQLFNERCQTCHGEGKGGAPRAGDIEAWKPRLKNGVEPLVKSAIGGHNAMPARAGMPDLSDREVRAAVEYMIGRLGGAAK